MAVAAAVAACGGGSSGDSVPGPPAQTPSGAAVPGSDGGRGDGVAPSSAGRITLDAARPGRISYSLSKAGKVSLSIYDARQQIVRTLLNAQPRHAGTHAETWDGKNDKGVLLPAGNYAFKMLQTPGLSAEYLMTLQTSLPIGSDWNDYAHWYGAYPLNEDREVGIGNHAGPTAITTDASGIYISTGGSENTSQMLKMAWDGSKRIWSAAQPDVGMGRYAMSVMGGRLYSLQQDGWVSHQGVDEPNFPYANVGPTKGSSGNDVGDRWDAQWPGERRGKADDWYQQKGAPMDMVAGDAGGKAQLVVSYFQHDSVQWRDAATGAVLRSAAVPSPRGVALDGKGRVLVATEDRVVRLSRNGQTLTTVISGLSAPYRITVDPGNGDVLVVEGGTDQRVKRFSADGRPRATYGRLGGRTDGLYVAADFRNITDISPDGSGGFFITEHAAPRRIAQFNGAGKWVREWYAGAT
jgi:hypothetical protein